jgi:hypothetical protein
MLWTRLAHHNLDEIVLCLKEFYWGFSRETFILERILQWNWIVRVQKTENASNVDVLL